MASIRKKNGRWEATISAGRDQNGKQIRKYVTADTRKECSDKAREIEQDIADGRFINIKNIRFTKWMDQWLELNKGRLSPSTFLTYKKYYVEIHFKPYFKNLKLSQVNEIILKNYISEKLQTLSSTTVRKHFLVLRKMLGDVLKHKNPAQYIEVPKVKKYVPHVVTENEFAEILNSSKGTHYEIVIYLAAWCGLRRGEICALKWDDIDFTNGTIRIDETLVKSESGYIFKPPKSDNGYRTIQAPNTLMNALLEYRKNNMDSTRIINLSPDTISHYMSDLRKKLGIDKVRFHDNRHYHSNWLYEHGIPDHHAAQRMGHDINTLKRIYQHLDLDKHKEIDKNIVDMLEKK